MITNKGAIIIKIIKLKAGVSSSRGFKYIVTAKSSH